MEKAMTPERYIILALSVACVLLAWVAFAPAPELPTVDPERWRIEERMRMREAELEVARDSIRVALLRVDTVEVVKYRTKVKHDSTANVRRSQNDSIQAVVLKERLRCCSSAYRDAFWQLTANVLWLCVRWGFPAPKPNSSNKL